MNVGDFQGSKNVDNGIYEFIGMEMAKKNLYSYYYQFFGTHKKAFIPHWDKGCGKNESVSGPEVPKVILERRLKAATDPVEQENIKKQLNKLLMNRKKLTNDVICT